MFDSDLIWSTVFIFLRKSVANFKTLSNILYWKMETGWAIMQMTVDDETSHNSK